LFRGDPEVIGAKLEKSGEGDAAVYRYDDWPKFFHDRLLQEYFERYKVDPEDPETGIKVYFDSGGCLHIDNCLDGGLRASIEKQMKRWYRSAERSFALAHAEDLKILELLEPYIEKAGPGSYRVKHGGDVFSFDEDYMDYLKRSGYLPLDHQSGNYKVDTGKPALDKILADILEEDELMLFTGLFQ
jgi:hypothetical protein